MSDALDLTILPVGGKALIRADKTQVQGQHKNFGTTAAQVTCPWSMLVLVKRLWMCQNNCQGDSKREKNAQMGFQNRRVWVDLGMPTFAVLFCLTLATHR